MSDETVSFDCVLGAWQAHSAELLGFLIRKVGERNTAEDLLQEVFLKSMRQGAGFCTLDNPRAWLFRVARNVLIDHARLKKPLEPLSDEFALPDPPERHPVDELDRCLQRNLMHLTPPDRDVIEQCDLRGQTLRAYAEANDLTLPAAKSRLLRARHRLRTFLVQNCRVQFDDSGRVCCHVPPDPS